MTIIKIDLNIAQKSTCINVLASKYVKVGVSIGAKKVDRVVIEIERTTSALAR